MESEIKTLCNLHGIKMVAKFGEAKKSRDWANNNWRVTLTRKVDGKRKRFSVDYFGGSAVKSIEAEYVITSVISDCLAGDQSFEEFCNEFGYDEDSRSVEKIWKECRIIGTRVKNFLGDDFETFVRAEQ